MSTQRLRLELLRMRAEIERAELAGALGELRSRTAVLRGVARAAGNVLGAAQGSTSRAPGWVALALTLLNQKPWVAMAAAGAMRVARARPLAVMAALAAALLVSRVRARRRGESGS